MTPAWLRRALLATAAMNILVGLAFASGSASILGAAGLPSGVDAFYTLTVGLFVLLFGLGYLGAAGAERPERLFIALGGVGKLSFVALVAALWMTGRLPARAPIAASPDLAFGLAFLAWSVGSR